MEHFRQTSDKYSLIITDLRMPGLGGIDLAKSMRTLGAPDIKIFLMTAFDTRDLEVQLTNTLLIKDPFLFFVQVFYYMRV
ncbi:response regulator [Candidatus Nitrosocosmicus sp. R]